MEKTKCFANLFEPQNIIESITLDDYHFKHKGLLVRRSSNTVEPRYPDTQFSRHSAYHVCFSKSRFSVYDFNVNKLRILRH